MRKMDRGKTGRVQGRHNKASRVAQTAGRRKLKRIAVAVRKNPKTAPAGVEEMIALLKGAKPTRPRENSVVAMSRVSVPLARRRKASRTARRVPKADNGLPARTTLIGPQERTRPAARLNAATGTMIARLRTAARVTRIRPGAPSLGMTRTG